jgi:probable metal-binding protein
MSSIHGHEVMHMMLESDQQFTIASLQAAIANRFGKDARFHTCSAEDMTAVELIEFLTKKGKFVPVGEGFSTQADKICNH